MLDRAVSVLRSRDERLIPVAGVYDIDGTHSAVRFIARNMMISKVRGRFKDVRGKITVAEEPELSHVEVEIRAASLDTGNSKRDAHLRSADFFGVDRYATITFRSTSVRSLPDSAWEVVGDLTIRDTTRPVRLLVGFDGADRSPLGEERLGFTATTEVNREDFGITWNQALDTGGVLIGNTVRIELSVRAIDATGAAVA